MDVNIFVFFIWVIVFVAIEIIMLKRYYSINAKAKKPTALICTTAALGMFFGFLLRFLAY